MCKHNRCFSESPSKEPHTSVESCRPLEAITNTRRGGLIPRPCGLGMRLGEEARLGNGRHNEIPPVHEGTVVQG